MNREGYRFAGTVLVPGATGAVKPSSGSVSWLIGAVAGQAHLVVFLGVGSSLGTGLVSNHGGRVGTARLGSFSFFLLALSSLCILYIVCDFYVTS